MINLNTFLQVLLGTGFTFLMTSLGAAVVFCFRGAISDAMNRAFLGFASGVMMAASVWSLLIPSIEQSGELGMAPWFPPALGFVFGGVFLYLMDKMLPWLHENSSPGMIDSSAGDLHSRSVISLVKICVNAFGHLVEPAAKVGFDQAASHPVLVKGSA